MGVAVTRRGPRDALATLPLRQEGHPLMPSPPPSPAFRRSMLADRLLGKGGYECDRELRTLELLKVRFGEGGLHGAEVMLKVRPRGCEGRMV